MTATVDYWSPCDPTADCPWNRRRAVHLHRRAGFAATWGELERDLAGSPQDAITRLLAGQTCIDGCPSDFSAMAATLSDAAVASHFDSRVKATWVYRMLFSPDPLGERLTILWHNHFATSNRKVQDLLKMWQQNELLRRGARGRFDELLSAAVRSPAMLVWLDADKNSAKNPNENLARELLELFTVGIGHYAEADVREASRALTGWKVVGDEFRFDRDRHDDGEKLILGRKQKFGGDELLALLASEPATARRVAWRLTHMLMGDDTAEEAAIQSLANGLSHHNMSIAWGVETVLRSQRFFATENLGTRIVGPPEFVVGAVRALECFAPPPSTLLLADWMSRMGQDLFYPPNVGGWADGRTWLTSASLVARANFAAALVEGHLTQTGTPSALEALVARHAGQGDLRSRVQWFAELLFGGLPNQAIETIAQQAARSGDSRFESCATAVFVLLTRPEAHLG